MAVKASEFEEFVRAKPTGIYTRRIWFLYEWLLGRELDLPAADKVAYADAVDTDLQYAGSRQSSAWHRVRNNMPGTPEFCPLVFKTKAIDTRTEDVFPACERERIRRVIERRGRKDRKPLSGFAQRRCVSSAPFPSGCA